MFLGIVFLVMFLGVFATIFIIISSFLTMVFLVMVFLVEVFSIFFITFTVFKAISCFLPFGMLAPAFFHSLAVFVICLSFCIQGADPIHGLALVHFRFSFSIFL